MKKRARNSYPGDELVRNLERILLFYSRARGPVVGDKPLDASRWAVLREACEVNGGRFQDIQLHVRVKAHTLSRIARWLVNRDLAKVSTHPRDRRTRILLATEKGRSTIRQIDEEIKHRMLEQMTASPYRLSRWKAASESARILSEQFENWVF
jgi:DNA-binding MarR family transcriptional regulator